MDHLDRTPALQPTSIPPYYGGGVVEMLSSLTLLMNASGIKTGWRVSIFRPRGAPNIRLQIYVG
jgi:hypothetical protein